MEAREVDQSSNESLSNTIQTLNSTQEVGIDVTTKLISQREQLLRSRDAVCLFIYICLYMFIYLLIYLFIMSYLIIIRFKKLMIH